jgi:hypothetical protein
MGEAVAFAIHLQDVHVVGQPIEQSAGQTFGAEHARPLVEWQIAGDDRRASLIALAENLEQQFGKKFDQTPFPVRQVAGIRAPPYWFCRARPRASARSHTRRRRSRAH